VGTRAYGGMVKKKKKKRDRWGSSPGSVNDNSGAIYVECEQEPTGSMNHFVGGEEVGEHEAGKSKRKCKEQQNARSGKTRDQKQTGD